MNIEDLRLLQKFSSTLKLMLIQPKENIDRKIIFFLEKHFPSFYYFSNPKEATHAFDFIQPDILLTQLTFLDYDLFEFLTSESFQKTHPLTIIINQIDENIELLSNFDIGIDTITLYPLSSEKFLELFIQRIKNRFYTLYEKDLESFFQSLLKEKTPFIDSFHNFKRQHYQAKLKDISHNQIYFSLPAQISTKKQDLNIVQFNTQNYVVSFYKEQINYIKRIQTIPIYLQEYENYVLNKIQVKFETMSDINQIKAISLKNEYLELFIPVFSKIFFEKKISINLGLELPSANSMIKEKRFEKILTQGETVSVEPYLNGFIFTTKLLLLKQHKRILERFINSI